MAFKFSGNSAWKGSKQGIKFHKKVIFLLLLLKLEIFNIVFLVCTNKLIYNHHAIYSQKGQAEVYSTSIFYRLCFVPSKTGWSLLYNTFLDPGIELGVSWNYLVGFDSPVNVIKMRHKQPYHLIALTQSTESQNSPGRPPGVHERLDGGPKVSMQPDKTLKNCLNLAPICV